MATISTGSFRLWPAFAFFACFVSPVFGGIDQLCLKCICQVEGCSKYIGRCDWDVTSDSCGPFQIKLAYWCDANRLSTVSCNDYDQEWRSCTKQMACSVHTVQQYMERYGTFCTGGVMPTCEDYARIHNGGPKGCRKSSTLGYWDKVKRCYHGVSNNKTTETGAGHGRTGGLFNGRLF